MLPPGMLAPVNSPVVTALLPVVLLIAVGWVAGRRGWIGGAAVRELSNLIFLLLAPALLFRSMSTVQVQQLSLRPVAAYFITAGLLYAATLALRGFNREAAVLALANTYSNTVMIGIPLIGLAYGAPGMVVLLTLVSLHSLILLTGATVVLELATARETQAADGGGRRRIAATAAWAVKMTPPTFTSYWRRYISSVISAIGHMSKTPALLKSTSSPPKRRSAISTAAAIELLSRTSSGTATARSPSEAASPDAVSISMSAMTTRAPSRT